ncbi:MAG: hypothetical protein HC767_00025 [Akkermansiaceae bacterium]|nr:hypothetical protein [Akkermansiaceae bacterium]
MKYYSDNATSSMQSCLEVDTENGRIRHLDSMALGSRAQQLKRMMGVVEEWVGQFHTGKVCDHTAELELNWSAVNTPVNNAGSGIPNVLRAAQEWIYSTYDENAAWRQTNGHDCGVFTLVFMRELSAVSGRDHMPVVRQEHMPQWRRIIALECYAEMMVQNV